MLKRYEHDHHEHKCLVDKKPFVEYVLTKYGDKSLPFSKTAFDKVSGILLAD